MLLQTSIYTSISKITASNCQEMLLRDSTLQRQHKLDFDEHNHKVHFVISWPNISVLLQKDIRLQNISTLKILNQFQLIWQAHQLLVLMISASSKGSDD